MATGVGFSAVSPAVDSKPAFASLASGSSAGVTVASPVLGHPAVGGAFAVTIGSMGFVVGVPAIDRPLLTSTNNFVPPPAPIVYTGDRHVRRSGDDYTVPFAALLPRGAAWPREPDTVLMSLIGGLAQIWGQPVDARAADLLERESDPRATIELLSDWERNWGLPDPCFGDQVSIAERQTMLVMKMTMLGGQSRAFFYSIAAQLGYTITISEFAPFMAGVSQCGDTSNLQRLRGDYSVGHMRWEIGPPEIRFYWTVHVGAVRLTWFRCGSGQCGIDPMVRIGLATDLECLMRRYAPAQTQVIFDYSGVGSIGDPLAGTP
jgi:uncharacterized protein YmfQ (DUF2313 family)